MEEIKAKDFKPGIIPYFTLHEIGKEEFVCGDKPIPFFYTNKVLCDALPVFAKGITLYGEITSNDGHKTINFKAVYFKTAFELIKSNLDLKIDLDCNVKYIDDIISLTILKYIG